MSIVRRLQQKRHDQNALSTKISQIYGPLGAASLHAVATKSISRQRLDFKSYEFEQEGAEFHKRRLLCFLCVLLFNLLRCDFFVGWNSLRATKILTTRHRFPAEQHKSEAKPCRVT